MTSRYSPLRWPLALQLAVAFALLTALALGGGGVLMLRQASQRMLADRSRSLLAQANAAANLASELEGRDSEALALALFRFHQQTAVRPVVLDEDGVVIGDGYQPSPLAGQRLTHPEVLAALAGEQMTGTRWLQTGGWVMYGAVPIWIAHEQVGAVLVSIDINAIDLALRDLQRQLLLVSLVAGTVAVALGVQVARVLTRPLVRLTGAVRLLARGRLETRVEPAGNRELIELGQHLNQMALELGRLDQQRRAFVSDASHELRTPVASIRALADGLLADRSGDVARYKEYLGDIARECDRAARLVERLLELARLDRRRESRQGAGAATVRVDLGAVTGEVVHALEPLAAERGVHLTWEEAGLIEADADPRLLETVLGNLIENGLKYTAPGGNVRVALMAGTGEALFVVWDTGVGIGPEDLPHIFERFYRVDKARTRATGGAGLGLAIAAEAADLLGGRIEVTSELGQGSRFTFRLPV